MAWLWLNTLLGALIFAAVCGIPAWLVIRHPDQDRRGDAVPQVALAAVSTAANPVSYAPAERDAA